MNSTARKLASILEIQTTDVQGSSASHFEYAVRAATCSFILDSESVRGRPPHSNVGFCCVANTSTCEFKIPMMQAIRGRQQFNGAGETRCKGDYIACFSKIEGFAQRAG